MKTEVFEQDSLDMAVKSLMCLLPLGWIAEAELNRGRSPRGADGMLRLEAPDGSQSHIPVEIKKTVFPRSVSMLLGRQPIDAAGLLVIAPFLTPSTRRALENAGVNYLDLTGNAWLTRDTPAMFIRTTGSQTPPTRAVPGNRSLKGPKAGRIVRALCDLAAPMSISKLGEFAEVDVSYASRIVEFLTREELVTRGRGRGLIEVVQRAALIRRWAQDYSVLNSNVSSTFLAARGLDSVEAVLRSSDANYAVSGSRAAATLAPVAPPRLMLLYVDGNVDEAARRLGLRPADTGGNVILLTPFDRVVFKRTWTADGLRLAAPSQVAVDLLTSPGRGPAEGEALLTAIERNAEGGIA